MYKKNGNADLKIIIAKIPNSQKYYTSRAAITPQASEVFIMVNKVIKTDVNQVGITSLDQMIGQRQVVNALKFYKKAYNNLRSIQEDSTVSFGPAMFTGPPGMGKTTTAKLLHSDLNNKFFLETNGETLNNKSELYDATILAKDGTTFFIDEAHALNSKIQDILLTAISEKIIHVPAKNQKDLRYDIPIANLTWILATTEEHQLKGPLRNRMKITCRFEYYSTGDLIEIIRQKLDILGWPYESEEVLYLIASRAKGTPRTALLRNLQTARDAAIGHNRELITVLDVREAFYYLQVDEIGLEKNDRSYLEILFNEGPTPLNILSSKLAVPCQTIQKVIEPYLIKEGYVVKDKASLRNITIKGRNHLKKTDEFRGS
jgi:Holliday junction resolvasome RuvABC ATP-dependent DNA helicase subunit